jgi:hypothetical protein
MSLLNEITQTFGNTNIRLDPSSSTVYRQLSIVDVAEHGCPVRENKDDSRKQRRSFPSRAGYLTFASYIFSFPFFLAIP